MSSVNIPILKTIVVVFLAWLSATALADAVLISFSGEAKVKAANSEVWREAKVNEVLTEGVTLKTEKYSNANLLFEDGTQIKLAENSALLIRALRNKSPSKVSSTDLLLSRGKIWGRSKQLPGDLTIATTTATATIRGTEWELVSISESDSSEESTEVTVVKGLVELSNRLGTARVPENTKGLAGISAPPRSQAVNRPRDRVSWISYYSVRPKLYVFAETKGYTQPPITEPDTSCVGIPMGDSLQNAKQSEHSLADVQRCAVSYVRQGDLANAQRLSEFYPEQKDTLLETQIRADSLALSGAYEAALKLLEPELAQRPTNSKLAIQIAAIHLHFGRLPLVKGFLKQISSSASGVGLGDIIVGDYQKLEGSFVKANEAYLAATNYADSEIEALEKLAELNYDYGKPLTAKKHLERLFVLQPENLKALALRAELLLSRNEFTRAASTFEQVLEIDSDNLVSLDGYSQALLGSSDTEGALANARKLGVIEPTVNNANLTSALIFHQKDSIVAATTELVEASEKDTNDPYPYFLLSAIHADENQPGLAIENSKDAIERLAYLKSLDKLATDQRGSANLGNAYSAFGLEESAEYLALKSYQPRWGGSPFFLAERQSDDFIRSSLSLRGYINEPAVFGSDKKKLALSNETGLNWEIIADARDDESYQQNLVKFGVSGFFEAPFTNSFLFQYGKGTLTDEALIPLENEEWASLVEQWSELELRYSAAFSGGDYFDPSIKPIRAYPGEAFEYKLSDTDSETITVGYGAQLTDTLNLFSIYIETEDQLPNFAMQIVPEKVKTPEAVLNYEGDLSAIGLDAAFTMLPVLSSATKAEVDQSLFLLAFKYDLNDSVSVLGKFSRSMSKRGEEGSFVGACGAQSYSGSLADSYLRNNASAMGGDLFYGLDWHYYYGYLGIDEAKALYPVFMDAANRFDNAALERLPGSCTVEALQNEALRTATDFSDVYGNTLNDYSLFVEGHGEEYQFSLGLELSKSTGYFSSTMDQREVNRLYGPLNDVFYLSSQMPLFGEYCLESPYQSPLCQVYNGNPDQTTILAASRQNYDSIVRLMQSKTEYNGYLSGHLAYQASDAVTLDYSISGTNIRSKFDKSYFSSDFESFSLEYLSLIFPGAENSELVDGVLSYTTRVEEMDTPNGYGDWKFSGGMGLTFEINPGLTIHGATTNLNRPSLNMSLAPMYLGLSPRLGMRTPSNSRIRTNTLALVVTPNENVRIFSRLSKSKIRQETIRDVSGWGGSFVQDSGKEALELLTANTFDQMRSNELRTIFNSVNSSRTLCSDCLETKSAEIVIDAVLNPQISVNASYVRNWKSKVSAPDASNLIEGSADCLAAQVDGTECDLSWRDQTFAINTFPLNYYRMGLSWSPTSQFKAMALGEYMTNVEFIRRGVGSIYDQEVIFNREGVDRGFRAHAMLRYRSKTGAFKLDLVARNLFSPYSRESVALRFGVAL